MSTFTPDPALYPFESRFFDGPMGRMHYVDEGEGPAILLCHGNPMWSFLYRHIIRALRGRFRCVAVDLLGFGLSERPAGFDYTGEAHARSVGDLVDHLELDDFLVMGQDWGGPVGLGVAVERADRVRGLVLGNTWCWPSTAYIKAFSHVASRQPAQWAIIQRNFFVRRLMPPNMSHDLTADELRHYTAVQPDPAARVGVAAFPAELRKSSLLPRLEREIPATLAHKPTLIPWGLRDRGFRPSEGERLRQVFPNHEYLPLPGAAHYIQEDAPDAIADGIIRRFG